MIDPNNDIIRFYIIRHGETDFNAAGIVQGRGVNSNLNEKGRGQAELFYQKYKDIPFDLVITSNLKRAQQTAEPFVINDKIHAIQDANIDEIHWGISEGKSSTVEMRDNYRAVLKHWKNGNYQVATTGGETPAELAERLLIFKQQVEGFSPIKVKNVLVVSHGRTLRALICLLKNEPLANMELYEHSNTGLFRADLEVSTSKWTVFGDMNTAHLA